VSSATLIRLVAGREISTRLRDKAFLISSGVLLLLIIGLTIFQVVLHDNQSKTTIGVVNGGSAAAAVLVQQGKAQGTDVTVRTLPSEAAARAAVKNGDVAVAVIDPVGTAPRVVVQKPGDSNEDIVRAGVAQLSTLRQLQDAGVRLQPPPTVREVALQRGTGDRTEAIVVAAIGVGLLYFLLILFGQFVAQGVVEEKSSRVVELLLATMRPWQLLAGKVLGLGLLGLAQILLIAVVGGVGAVAFDVVSVPGQVVGTIVSVVLWFILGYALYASIFAAAASLVSRQEDLGTVIMPLTLVLVAGFVIAVQAVGNPAGTLATVTSLVPGLSPLVMPVRIAAGEAPVWQVVLAVVLMLAAIAVVVRIGGRVYAGALLRTGGKIKIREALAAGRN
jgi:ABC-2 type transport system permease protein